MERTLSERWLYLLPFQGSELDPTSNGQFLSTYSTVLPNLQDGSDPKNIFWYKIFIPWKWNIVATNNVVSLFMTYNSGHVLGWAAPVKWNPSAQVSPYAYEATRCQ